MDIPEFLLTELRRGNVVPVLGSGASLEATDPGGSHPPSTADLATELSKQFLGGKYKGLGLAQVGEYAISESDLVTVQEYIRERLDPFQPSPAHRLLPSFRWRALATTNYDRLIERAYDADRDRIQELRPFLDNFDRVDVWLRDPRSVMLLKLHGCLTRTTNLACPLILTPEQYISHRKCRERLFDHLRELGSEVPLLFVGHSLQDSDLRTILLELVSLAPSRPRYFAVIPGVDEIMRRFWEGYRVTLLDGTFGDLMATLDRKLAANVRRAAAAMPAIEHPIERRFSVPNASLPESCAQFLSVDAEYVSTSTSAGTVTARDFYRGLNPGWAAIEKGLDVRRHLGDSLLADHFLVDEAEHAGGVEILLIRAAAGAGKSVLLRRLAWDASHEYDKLCLFMRESGVIDPGPLRDLARLCNERIFLFVDDAADRVREIQVLIKRMGPEARSLTVILAERLNEWNIAGQELEPQVSNAYDLKNLSGKEIDALLALLETHRALGTLEDKSPDQRRAAFTERAGRQLLVALHEATLGKPFEEIIEDEFRAVKPLEAQRLYLTICVLNRLDVQVRAGVISRIHGITFDAFKDRFFMPLAHIVQTVYDPVARDYMYETRHPHIAQIVFERILANVEERFDAYIKALTALNVQYSTDRRAFRRMLRARSLGELFADGALVRQIYSLARDRAAEEPFVYQQMGIFEMNASNLDLAAEYLGQSKRLAPRDLSVQHSLAELQLRRADQGRTVLERGVFLDEAEASARNLRQVDSEGGYGYHTLAKVGLRRLRDLLESSEEPSDEAIEHLLKNIESNLSEGLQHFPDEPYLLEAEAQLASLLDDQTRAVRALERAFAINPRSTYVAMRLARHYARSVDEEKAKDILTRALEANPGERRLHFALAELLLRSGGGGDEIEYHLQRSYSEGDKNYEAQLLHARQLFLNGNNERAREIFRILGSAPVGLELRHKPRFPMAEAISGRVDKLESGYGFVGRDGSGDWVYFSRANVKDEFWSRLRVGTRVKCTVAFNLKGPTCIDMNLED